nr:hypothetical protein [Tanacetum cinerariifolium]
MESCDPIGTPMEIKDKLDLDQNGTPVDATEYRSMIGALMYLTSSRPDIDSGFELTGFSDADYAGCKDTFKSTSGGAQFLGEKLWPDLRDPRHATPPPAAALPPLHQPAPLHHRHSSPPPHYHRPLPSPTMAAATYAATTPTAAAALWQPTPLPQPTPTATLPIKVLFGSGFNSPTGAFGSLFNSQTGAFGLL